MKEALKCTYFSSPRKGRWCTDWNTQPCEL